MNLEWRQPSKKLRFVLLDTKFASENNYLQLGVVGRVEERKQRNGTIIWEGGVWVPPESTLRWFRSRTYKKQMFRKKAEAMAMVAVSVKLENYDGFE